MKMDPRFLLLISLVLLLAAGTGSHAVQTSIWTQADQKAFESDKPEGVAITAKGVVQLSPALEQTKDLKEAYVWDLAEDSAGNLYVATGNEGRIYRIVSDGSGADTPFADTPEIDIRSLAFSPDGTLYAGTAPDGLVYKVSSDGNFLPVFVSKQKYVWDLAFDDAGNLYVGTGPEGKLFKITPEGESSEVFDSEDPHIMCLLFHEGALYAGTAGTGIVYKIDDGKTTAVYHTRQKEVHNILFDADGNLYIAATTGEAAQKPPAPNSGGPPPGSGPPQEPKARIFRVNPEGIPFHVWESPEPLILSLTLNTAGNLIVGTGDSGKLYEVTPDGESTYLEKVEEAQILVLLQTSTGAIAAGTGNGGKLYSLAETHVAEGSLESTVQDAGVLSSWGRISWEAEVPEGTTLEFMTHTGMTEKPDKTWSDWSTPTTESAGSLISSPDARYIQWKAVLKATDTALTPALKRVDLAYVQRNVEPDLGDIKVSLGEGKPKGNQPPDRGKRTVEWQARDRNKDQLEYTLYYRQTDETTWKLLKEKLKETKYTWDATAMPDGEYEIQVVATDKWSNPEGTEQSYGHESPPFRIDNTQPTLSPISVVAEGEGQFRVTCQAEDSMHRIASAEYSIDGGKWRVVFSEDGVFDSLSETFSFLTPRQEAGQHTLVLKISDGAGNQQTGRVVFGQ